MFLSGVHDMFLTMHSLETYDLVELPLGSIEDTCDKVLCEVMCGYHSVLTVSDGRSNRR